MPSIVDQLGVVPYLFLIFSELSFNFCTCFLANEVFNNVLSERGFKISDEMIRQPIKSFTQQIFGYKSLFSELVIWMQTVVNFCFMLSFILVSATILQSVVPISNISVDNQIRLHAVFLGILLVPISQFNTFKEMSVSACLCFLSAIITETLLLVSMFIISNTVSVHVPENTNNAQKNNTENDDLPISKVIILARCAGVIAYSTSGPITVLPNAIVVMTSRKYLRFSILFGIIGVFLLNFVAGVIPYYLIAGSYPISDSFMNTLSDIAHKFAANNNTLAAVIMLSQVTVTFHCLLAITICMNPVHLFVEEKLSIPRGNLIEQCEVYISIQWRV